MPAKTPADRQLAEYARLFDAVEGNGSFYGLPSAESVLRWKEATPERFRFVQKVPRRITHELALENYAAELRQVVERFEPMAERLGPMMLQLPPQAGRGALDRIARFLEAAPSIFRWSVEVRHPDWFDGGRNERDLHGLLARHGAERVVLDSRPLYSGGASDPSTAAAQGKKPRVPPRQVGLSQTPILRFIGRNVAAECDHYLSGWSKVVAKWIGQGKTPFVFCHAPEERFAPALCRRFHEHLRRVLPELEPVPDWPLLPEERSQLRLL